MNLLLPRLVGRFTVAGIGITALHVVVVTALIELTGLQSVTANIIAFMVANAASYSLHTRWSFAVSPSLRSGQRFFVVSVIGFLLSGSISGGAQWLELPYEVGTVLVVTIVPTVNFLLHRFWTYRL